MTVACPWFVAALDPELCRAVDHYCERTSTASDAEPVNALSNLAFLLAGFAAWRLRARRPGKHDLLTDVIILTIPVVGLGSMLFHTLATRWAEWGDVIPILVFMMLYLWLALRRFLACSPWAAGAALAAFLAATLYLEAAVPGRFLWGGALYLPTVLALSVIGLGLNRRGMAVARPFLAATGVFLLSFAARTIDEPLCAAFPLGTHFLWHLLNALLLWLLARAAMLHAPHERQRAG